MSAANSRTPSSDNARPRLVIVGAGGFGREVARWAAAVPPSDRDWELGAFLDAKPDALAGHDIPWSIAGDPATYRPLVTDRFICAIGDPKTKLSVCRQLTERGAVFTSLRHPTAVVGSSSRIGEGAILCPYAILTDSATLGRFVTLNVHATVGHDATIGDGSTLSGHCDVTGFARLGQGVFLGSSAVILPRVEVGDFACVGAGSVVVRRVPAGATVFGVPAMAIKSGEG